jgi:transposase
MRRRRAWRFVEVADVASTVGVTSRTVEHLKQRFVEEGLEAALARKAHRKPREATFDGAWRFNTQDARIKLTRFYPKL